MSLAAGVNASAAYASYLIRVGLISLGALGVTGMLRKRQSGLGLGGPGRAHHGWDYADYGYNRGDYGAYPPWDYDVYKAPYNRDEFYPPDGYENSLSWRDRDLWGSKNYREQGRHPTENEKQNMSPEERKYYEDYYKKYYDDYYKSYWENYRKFSSRTGSEDSRRYRERRRSKDGNSGGRRKYKDGIDGERVGTKDGVVEANKTR